MLMVMRRMKNKDEGENVEDADGEGDDNNKGEGENVDAVDGEGDENNKGDGEVGDPEEDMGLNGEEAFFLSLF